MERTKVNILLVDDDVNVLESLQFGVSYSELGIDKVYVAENAIEAKIILKSVPIHIMVTDIEMPNESGIDLLKWTKKENMDIVTIFCTCYADFNYAKKAVELQCFDYYLKPISFVDYEKIILKAVEKVQEEINKKKYYQYGVYWLDDIKNRKEHFWEHIMLPLTIPDEEFLMSLIEESKLDYTSNERFDVFLVHIYESEKRFHSLTATMSEFVVKNVVNEIFSETCNLETIIKYREDVYVIVATNSKYMISSILHKLIDQCNEFLKCSIRVIYDVGQSLIEVKDCFEKLVHVWNENIGNNIPLIYLKNYQKEDNTYSFGNLNDWEVYLNNGAVDHILDEIEQYLMERKQQNKLSLYQVKSLQINLIQMVSTVLMKNNIEAHELFVNAEYEQFHKKSLTSYENYIEYCRFLLMKADKCINYLKENTSIIDIVKQYINDHYNEEISRNDLAKIVYLNADYLARLFKKEEGISITDYVIKIRMKKVSELLMYSDLSINEIAMKTGYDNFSYFSRICKKMLGCSPKDYRKKGKEESQ